MGEMASRAQLRMSGVRRGIVVVPLILLLGLASGRLANSGYGNAWFAGLAKPDFTPPGWAFGAAWTVLYLMMGVALTIVLSARGAAMRKQAIIWFVAQLALNLAWSPLFFAAHEIRAALVLIAAILAAAAVATVRFWQVRRVAGLLMLPYLAWLCFAAALNFEILRMNPGGGPLAPGTVSTQVDV